jgi:hypothetical protein
MTKVLLSPFVFVGLIFAGAVGSIALAEILRFV